MLYGLMMLIVPVMVMMIMIMIMLSVIFRWYRKGEANPLEGAISKPGGSRSVATLSTLMVRPQKEDDGTEYRCVAWNRAMDANDKKEATVSLTVNCNSFSYSYSYSH